MIKTELTAVECQDLARSFSKPWYRHYSASKLKTDPLYRGVAGALKAGDPTLPLLDIGCGIGLLAFYLRRCGMNAPVHGVDYDRKKIDEAVRMSERMPGSETFEYGDGREGLPPFEGNVTLLDLLQFFQPEEQDRFLREAARRVGAGGRLIIRTGLCDDSRRFRITRGADCLARAVFWMKSGPIHYPTRDSLRDSLEGEGMTGDFQPLWGKTPFNNFLTVWTR